MSELKNDNILSVKKNNFHIVKPHKKKSFPSDSIPEDGNINNNYNNDNDNDNNSNLNNLNDNFDEDSSLSDENGNGLDDDIINSFPKTIIEDENKLKEKQCVICLEEFKTGDEQTTVPCFHVFHPDCINKWLTKNNSCPICKTEFN